MRDPLGCRMPYRRLAIRTTLPSAEAERRISSLIGPRRSFTEYFQRSTGTEYPFEGEAVGGGFRFARRIHYRNSFLPQIRARVELDESGTVVRIQMSIRPFVIAFMVFWIGAASSGFFVHSTSGKDGILIPSVMVVFGLALIAFGFYPEARKAERIVRHALDAAA